MMRPELVADISRAIADKTTIVPSIKCRIGVNDDDHYGYLANFVDVVSRKGGVSQFIIHARKAVLDPAWSPQKNRTIPPLKYEYVYQLLREFPHLDIGINGGIKSYEEIVSHVQHGADEVMIGRGVMENPFYYRHIDQLIKSSSTSAALTPSLVTRGEVLRKYVSYIQQQEAAVQDGTVSCSYLLSPVLNLFTGCRNGRLFRRILSELEKDSLSAKKIGDEVLRASEVISIDVMDS